MKCPHCNSENPAGSVSCVNCARPLHTPGDVSFSEVGTVQAPVSELARASTLAGRYEVIEELGRGGMGRVYRVLDKEIDEEIALKLLAPEIAAQQKTVERFRNELKLARRISHRNVCRVFHLGEEQGSYYITMEYVSGEDLKTLIKRIGPLTVEKTISLGKQICEGLTEAHRLGVVHRDLKPQNIMIDQQGNVRIMDFGIARSFQAKGITEVGVAVGTPEYMSPEQVEAKEVDSRSDIYSVGAILFEMTTGRLPFEGATPFSVAIKHKTEAPPHPRELSPNLPEDLSRVILRCLEKEKEKRFPGAEELLSALTEIEKGKPPVALPLSLEGVEEEPERPVFVARESELDKIRRFLNMAVTGQGQVVFITGEAGSGKTALVSEVAHRAEQTHPDLLVVSGRCNAHTGIGDPYLPFREVLSLLTGDVESRRAVGVMTKNSVRRLWNILPISAQAVMETGPDLIDTLVPGRALLKRVMAIAPVGTEWIEGLKRLVERKSAMPADSALQQINLFEQTTRVLQALSRSQPLLLLLDDLQWADSGSISLLFHLGRRIGSSRILIVGAYRPSEVSIVREGGRHPLEVVLNELRRDFGDFEVGLDQAEDRQFLDAFLDAEPNQLGKAFRDTLCQQTKGHPLFTIELLRGMQDRGMLVRDEEGHWVEGPALEWDALPARVDAVIEERIGRLDDHLHEALTHASVEGEEFTAEVVAELQQTDVRQLIHLLSGDLEKRHHLVSAKGIERVNGKRLSRYRFQHILFQRYLYNNMDEVERSYLHETVANALEKLYGERVDEVAVQLARHFQEAGITSKAMEYLQKAGSRAVRVTANEEAIALFSRALEMLETLPDTPERAEKELELQLALTVPLQAARGFGAPELGRAVVRARELCRQIGDERQLFTALIQLASFYATRAEYRTALELRDQIINLATTSKDPLFSAISYYVQTWPLLNVGEFVAVVESADRMMAFYDPTQHGFLGYLYGYDLGVLNLGFGSWALWFLGYPERALKQLDDALALARKLNHPHTLAFALVGACELHWFLRDPDAVCKYTEELVPLSDDRGFVYWQAHGIFYRGERQTLEEEVVKGIEQMHQGIAAMRATGTETCLTRLYTRMVEACMKVGRLDEALAVSAAARKLMDKYDERYMEAELHRHRGELLQAQGKEDGEVEACFVKALEVARQQQARSLELRAAMSLSRLWRNQGKTMEACRLLTDIYGWFTEGFDTPDLVEAKTLLGELSDSASLSR